MPGVAVAQLNIVKEFSGSGAGSSLGPVGSTGEPPLRVTQLEHNIRFLQDQHHLMLTGLHKEIESLRQKNRDLQFQLVFSKGKTESNHSTAKTLVKEESTNNSVKSSPRTSRDLSVEQILPPPKENDSSDNETDAERCERLERELSTTNTALQTSLSRTIALQSLLHQHNEDGMIFRIEESEACELERESGGESARLAEAERLVRRLRQETADQRREVLPLPTSGSPSACSGGGVTNLLFDTAAPIARNYLQSIKASLSAGGRGRGGGHRGAPAPPPGLSQAAFPPLWHQSNREPKPATKAKTTSMIGQISKPKTVIAFGRAQTISRDKVAPRVKPPTMKTTSTIPNEYHGWSRGNRRSSEKNDAASSSGTTAAPAVPPTTLPDLRTSNNYNNGNSNNSQNQNQSRRGNGGNHGYGNSHYYRNSDRGYRGGDRNNREDDPPQRRTYNTPTELSEGEVEPTNENHPTHGHSHRNNTYRNKRGQNKYQDKS